MLRLIVGVGLRIDSMLNKAFY